MNQEELLDQVKRALHSELSKCKDYYSTIAEEVYGPNFTPEQRHIVKKVVLKILFSS